MYYLNRPLYSDGLLKDSPEEVTQCVEGLISDLIVKTKTAMDRLSHFDGETTGYRIVVLKRQARARDVEPDHVRLRPRDELAPELLPEGRGAPGLVLRTLHLAAEEDVVDGHARRGRDDARRAHAAAEELARPVGALHEGGRAGDDAADGRAEALGEAHLDAVEARADLAQRAGAGGGGLPEARAVQVHVDGGILGARPPRDGADVVERQDGAPERVLQADDARRGVVVGLGDDGVALDVLQGEMVAVGGHDALDQRAAEAGGTAALPVDDVAAVVGEDAVGWGLEGRAERHLVAHAAGHDEDGGLVADQAGHVFLE